MTVHDVPLALMRLLRQRARSRHKSLDATILEILRESLLADRRARLAHYVTWTAADLREFEDALRPQRLPA